MEAKSVKVCGGRIESSLGSKLGLSYVGRDGKRYPVPIYNGKRQNHFYALFDEEDVDFEIDMDNNHCERKVRYGVEIQKKKECYLVRGGAGWKMETLDNLGPKLHFVRQSSDDGLAIIVRVADKNNITLDESAELVSQIKFDVSYSPKIGEPFDAYVDFPNKGQKKFRLNYSATIADLKKAIERELGVHKQRQSIFNLRNKELADHSIYHEVADSLVKLCYNFQIFVYGIDNTTLALTVCEQTTSKTILAMIGERVGLKMSQELLRFGLKTLKTDVPLKKYGIKEKDILHLSMKLLGGHLADSSTSVFSFSDCDSDEEVGERGVICAGEKSNQKFG